MPKKLITTGMLLLAMFIAAPAVTIAADWNVESLGGPFDKFRPAMVAWGNDKLGAFVRRSDSSTWYRLKSGGAWGPWTDLQGCSNFTPQVVSWGPGHIAAFIVGCNSTTLKYKEFNGTSWSSSWTNLTGKYNTVPSPVSLRQGHLAVFIVGSDDKVYYLEYSNGAWTGQQALGFTTEGSVKALAFGPDKMAVFASGTERNVPQLHVRMQTAGTWNSWAGIGGDLVELRPGLCEVSGHGAPFAPTSWGDGHIAIFAMKSGTLSYRTFMDGAWGAGWIYVSPVKTVPTLMTVPKRASKVGTLDVFYQDIREFCDKRDEDFKLWHSRLVGTEWTHELMSNERAVSFSDPITPAPGGISLLAAYESAPTSLNHHFQVGSPSNSWLPAILELLMD